MIDWANENQTAAQVIYNWRKEDKYGELTEPCTLDAIIYDELEDGAELDNDAIFDALATESKRLERTAQLVGRSLNRTSSTLEIVENGIHISKPMRKNGATNIAIIYELTDGQTVSVLFHNPDTTPNKLKPDDMMIAWRWLLNRKDITIVVAKEKGRDLPIQQIANRVMALADKNTARFAKANAQKAEETQLIKALEEENTRLEERLEYLNKLAEERENSGNSENLNDLFNIATSQKDGNKNFVNLGVLSERTVKAILDLTGENVSDWTVSIDESAIRHILKQHGNADAEEKRGQVAVEKSDFEKVLDVVNNYDELHLGDEPNTLKFIKKIGNQYIVIEEMRLGRKKLSLKTMYKRKQLTYAPVAPETHQSTAETSETFVSQVAENNDKANSDDYQDEEEVSGSLKDETQDAPIELTGKEFENSKLDLSVKENKAILRKEVQDYLKNMIGDKGIYIHNLALDKDVLLNNRSISEMLHYSGDPRKLNLMKHIKEIIATAKPENNEVQLLSNNKQDKKPNVQGYYHFINHFAIDGESKKLFVFFEVDDKGVLHYDFMIPKEKAAFDGLRNCPTLTRCGIERTIKAACNDYTATFDNTQEKYVLNLFIFDENGNEIKDEEENSEDEEVSGSLNDKFDKQCNERKKEFISMLAVSQNDIEEEIKRVNSVKEYFTDEVYTRAIRNAKLGALKHKYFDVLYKDENRFKKGDIVWEVEPTSNHYEYRIRRHFNDEAIAASDKLSSAILYDVIKIFKRNDPNERISGELSMAMPKAAVEAFEELKKQYEDEIEKEINIQQIETDLNSYKDDENTSNTQAARNFVTQMQGKFVMASNGVKVWFNNKSKGELGRGTKYDELRAAIVPFIPQTLQTGKYLGREALRTQRKDAFIAFHEYQGEVSIDDKNIVHIVKVGEKENGIYEFVAYFSHYKNDATMDALDAQKPLAVVKSSGRGFQAGKNAIGETIQLNNDKVNHFVADSIADGKDGWNIEIISINGIPFDENGNEIKDEEDEEVSGSLKEEAQDAPIELTGKEFGDFDTNTEDGKKALRQAASDYLMKLAENGETVFCPALNADVGFIKSAAKKYKKLSGDPIKLQIAAQIKQIIAKGKVFKPSEKDYTGKSNQIFHYLKTAAKVAGVEYGIRFIVREDVDGHFHYDLQVKDSIHSIMDGLHERNDKAFSANKSDIPCRFEPETNSGLAQCNTIFDDTQEKYVLNLFIFDENGNEIKDEEDDSGSLKGIE